MKFLILLLAWFTFGFGRAPYYAGDSPDLHLSENEKTVSPDQGLFTDENVLDIKLIGPLRDLFNDRKEVSTYRPIQLSYRDADSNEILISLKARTRGHFRKSMGGCTYPPIYLNFSKKGMPAKSLFAGQDKIKLVMPCQGDQYVVREWLLYKVYNLVTEKSFRARLVRIALDDTQKKKKASPFYGILLEDDSAMARRNKMVSVEAKMLKGEQTEKSAYLKMAVFQYLIGNTDWSVQYQQNIKLIASKPSALPYTVPYDFDHAGLVSAPYALPAEELLMKSVRERRYRGFCIQDMSEFKETMEFFNKLKESIYKLYTSNPLLDSKYIRTATQYLDDFYATINNEKKMKSDFGYPCDKNGTGNIIISGLKNN